MGLPAGLVDAVLLGLGLDGAPRADGDGLARLYRAWCERVPFDNVLKMLHLTESWPGPLPGSTGVDFFRAWIEYRAGGTCWAGNGALFELVTKLGFRAELGAATMMSSPDTAGPNHGTVVVTLDDGARVVVDASILSGEPLALPDPRAAAQAQGQAQAQAQAHGQGQGQAQAGERLPRALVIAGRPVILWRTLRQPDGLHCRIDRIGLDAGEWDALHQRTAGWSPFNFAVSARLNRGDDEVIGYGLGQRWSFRGEEALAAEPVDRAARDRFLVDEVGIDPLLAARLPDDQPVPPAPAELPALPARPAAREG